MARSSQTPRPSPLAIAALVVTVLLVSQGAGAQEGSDSCAPPAGLRAAVQERFGSSRVLTLPDLYQEERAAFKAEHRGACPGMAAGRFFGAGERPATALVLLGVGPTKEVRLVVARPAMSSWTFVELDALDTGATAVVSTGRPGTFGASPRGKAPKRDQDAVLLTAIETWQRTYVWNGRTFEKRQTNQ